MRVYIYTRVSSDDQVDGFSLKQQIDACQNFAKAREWDVVEIFVEEGESAFRDGLKRPRLREMFGRVKSDGVERIIVWKFSRFARYQEEHHALQAMLAKDDARCVSVSEQVEDNAAGHLLEGVMAARQCQRKGVLGRTAFLLREGQRLECLAVEDVGRGHPLLELAD